MVGYKLKTLRFVSGRILLAMISLITITSCMNNSQGEKHLEIVQSLYADRNNLEKNLADDAIWIEAEGFPYKGTYVGYDAVVENVFSKLRSEWDGFKFSPEGYVSEKGQVVVHGRYTGVYKKSQKPLDVRALHFYSLEEDKIVRFEQFVDTHIVLESMKVDDID